MEKGYKTWRTSETVNDIGANENRVQAMQQMFVSQLPVPNKTGINQQHLTNRVNKLSLSLKEDQIRINRLSKSCVKN